MESRDENHIARAPAAAGAPTAPRSLLLSHAQLHRTIAPRSVAIVGASARRGSFGERAIAHLQPFDGARYLVNAGYDRIGETPCYPSLSALPAVPDCVVLAVPREATESVLTEAASLGAGGAVVFASGYAETGVPRYVELQARLASIAQESGLRILGPNCLGFANYAIGAVLSFVPFAPARCAPGRNVAIVSQSGALGLALAQAAHRGVAFSHALSYGNACDVDAADLIAYLADDADCNAIACLLEGSPSPGRIVDAARLAAERGKPVVMCKIATGAEGARAALSHTGSLSGEDVAFRACLRDAGVALVDDFEALVETAAFFAKAPRPLRSAQGVAVIAGSGGAGIMAADKAEAHGVPLPQPPADVQRVLAQHVPEYGSPRNPCDVTAQVLNHPESLVACTRALATDAGYAAIVAPWPMAAESFSWRLRTFEDAARDSGKPVCVVWLTEWLEGPLAVQCEQSAHVALFRSMDRCFAALGHWLRTSATPGAHDDPPSRPSDEAVAAARERLRACATGTLTERESKQLLSLYGVPVLQDEPADTAERAVAAAERAGYPVVVKIESPDIAHKSEVGGIRLDLRSRDDVVAAFDAVMASASRAAPHARLQGVVVAPMVRGGIELIVGGRIDAQFGPLVTVGLGGVLVELIADVAVAPAPVGVARAMSMLHSLRAARVLSGYRGMAAVPLERLADIVSRVSCFLHDMRDLVQELDVNPLMCRGADIVAVDALVVPTCAGSQRSTG